jgi:hypothetical protein
MRWIAPIALALSLLALGVSVWNWHRAEARAMQAEERAASATEAAIRRHEEATVEKYRPALARLCRDYGLQHPDPPRSVADILIVLFKLLEGFSR